MRRNQAMANNTHIIAWYALATSKLMEQLGRRQCFMIVAYVLVVIISLVAVLVDIGVPVLI